MKEISEEWQMKIFDLLEGNLSGDEKASVLAAISGDADLKREYDLMAQTYLTPEPAVVFDAKASLYKSAGGGKLLISWKWYAAAAAITLLIGGGVVFNRMGDQGTAPAYSGTSAVKPVKPAPGVVEKPQLEEQPKVLTPALPADRQVAASPVVVKQQARKDSVPAPAAPALPAPDFRHLAGMGLHTMDLQMYPALENTAIVFVDQANQPVSYKKKKTLSYKLMNNTRNMIANLQLPDVKFKTGKGKNKILPSLKMEIRTPDTQVIATLIE